LTRVLGGSPTEPRNYRQIFERGIDPDVDNPEHCHSHSEIPDEWPPLAEILDYQDRVRSRIESVLQRDDITRNRCLGEALWIGFEHEAMHLETFLYMLLQSDKTLPPPLADRPDFEKLFHQARANAKPNEWFAIPEQTLSIGLDDTDERSLPDVSFGWYNEKPQRTITVRAFEAQARAITNGEYAKYLQATRQRRRPESWVLTHSDENYPISKGVTLESSQATKDFMDNFAVRTVFGRIPLEFAQDWPVMASYDELSQYAEWVGCRLPTYEEVKSIYNFSAQLKEARHEPSDHERFVFSTKCLETCPRLTKVATVSTASTALTVIW
jgi:formylglycine-generating enzyme required for sulfatase activity